MTWVTFHTLLFNNLTINTSKLCKKSNVYISYLKSHPGNPINGGVAIWAKSTQRPQLKQHLECQYSIIVKMLKFLWIWQNTLYCQVSLKIVLFDWCQGAFGFCEQSKSHKTSVKMIKLFLVTGASRHGFSFSVVML